MSISEPGRIGRLGGGAAASNGGAGRAGGAADLGGSASASAFTGWGGAGGAWGAALPSAAVKNARWAAIASALRARVGAVGVAVGESGVIGGMGRIMVNRL